MPTYVYECSSCTKVFEADQRIVEDPLDTCVLCQSKGTVKRIIQPIAVMFKGSGFHINDYKSSGAPPVATTAAETPAATEPPAAAEPAPAPTPPAPSTPESGS